MSQTHPTPPEHVADDDLAVAEWRRVAEKNPAADPALLEVYVAAYARWRRSSDRVAETGDVVKSPGGYPMVNPYLDVARKASAEMRALAKMLGLPEPVSSSTTRRAKPTVAKPRPPLRLAGEGAA
jgi:P27 family predicted phage terminase small subunit